MVDCAYVEEGIVPSKMTFYCVTCGKRRRQRGVNADKPGAGENGAGRCERLPRHATYIEKPPWNLQTSTAYHLLEKTLLEEWRVERRSPSERHVRCCPSSSLHDGRINLPLRAVYGMSPLASTLSVVSLIDEESFFYV